MKFNLQIRDADIAVRLIEASDTALLYQYLQNLSAETVKRFQPHPFDFSTVENICRNCAEENIFRFVAVANGEIIAYMLFKKGWVDEDRSRYMQRGQFFNEHKLITFAPSVADAWQNCGLGSAMYQQIEKQLQKAGYETIVLWGGVQALNNRAVHYYEKSNYQHLGSYYWNEMNNYDMAKRL